MYVPSDAQCWHFQHNLFFSCKNLKKVGSISRARFSQPHPPPGESQVYGAMKRSAKKAKGGAKLGTIEAAVLGSGATLAAQAVTTPLDVVRTRVMTASPCDEEYEGDTMTAAHCGVQFTS